MGGLKITKILVSISILMLAASYRPGFAQQGGISIGDTVEVATTGSNLNLRAEASTHSAVVASLPNGTRLNVVGGPRSADGYTWWELEGAPGHGWAAGQFLRVVNNAPSAPGAALDYGCQSIPYPGIQYTDLDQGETHLVTIDLNDPHVGIETVMANNVNNVNTGNRETAEHMAARYREQGVVAVINADYFGDAAPRHGPEGLTVVNGQRLDGEERGDTDHNAVNRSSLSIGRPLVAGGQAPLAVHIQRFDSDRIQVDPAQMFNAVGGGPQVVFDGRWDWSTGRNHPRYRSCPADIPDSDVINGECFRGTGDWASPDKMWTTVGITGDGHMLILVTPYRNVQANLQAQAAQQAIKLDGGGSSQLWFNGDPVVRGGRSVADGLMVSYKLNYQVLEQSRWPVVIDGERVNIRLALRNTGADTWTTEDYSIGSENNPWSQSLRLRLPSDVNPGCVLEWEWQSEAITGTGIKTLELSLYGNGTRFPVDPIQVKVIVLPHELAQRRAEIEQQIQEWLQQGRQDLEQRIRDYIQRELQRRVSTGCCNLAPFALPVGALIVFGKARRRRGGRSEKNGEARPDGG